MLCAGRNLQNSNHQEVFQADARNLKALIQNEVAELVLSHPPYFNCIPYSSDREVDLSKCRTFADFTRGMRCVAEETHRILKPNIGRCFLMVGDNREEKFIVPIAFEMMLIYVSLGFVLEELVSNSCFLLIFRL